MAVALVLLAAAWRNWPVKQKYKEIKNPVYVLANDPWVVRREEDYYYCWSTSGIRVKKIGNLDEISASEGTLVWQPEADAPWGKELWAPELHYLQGQWYIYVAACDGPNENHRMYVLRGTTQDPTDPFELVGQITDPTNRWAIDGTVMEYRKELYFIWSGWEGSVDVGQQLYIAHMASPTEIDSQRVCISRPTHDWERIGLPINEGPAALVKGKNAALVFSASGSWTDDYCLGLLTLTGEDPLDPDCWEKHPEPVFTKVHGTYGPGHCCFTTGYDGSTWMIYHANLLSGTGWAGRSGRIQPVAWDGITLELGEAARPGKTLLLPVRSGGDS